MPRTQASAQLVLHVGIGPGKGELDVQEAVVDAAQLDDEAVFYLRSRGIGEAAARSLLTFLPRTSRGSCSASAPPRSVPGIT